MTETNTPNTALREAIVAAIKTVFDPEIPVDIWELGLIYEIKIPETPEGDSNEPGNEPGNEAGKEVEIVMTLTSPMCPVAGSMPFEVKQKVEGVEGVTNAEIEMTYDPPWTKDMMSDEARVELDMF